MIGSLVAVTPFTPEADCVHSPWLAVGPARVGDLLVGVSIRIGRRALMIDVPRRINLALALQTCCCCGEDLDDEE